MLNPELAKRQLQQWMVTGPDATSEDDEGGVSRFLPQVAKLPQALRPAAYALLNRSADGKAIGHADWREYQSARNRSLATLDQLSKAQRLSLFSSFFPKIAPQVEHCWEMLKRATYPQGWTRRAFRAPNLPAATLGHRGDWLQALLQITSRFKDEVVTCPFLAAWAPHLEVRHGHDQNAIGRLLAAVMDMGGVWKTFHDLGLTASVRFDYGITTPLEVEGLTIEGVQFFHRDKPEPLQLADVPARVFSETMRDMDLVVSVAHRGGVDPEASASTVQMTSESDSRDVFAPRD